MTVPSRNPFQAPPAADAGLSQVEDVERVEKPWGYEEIVAVLDGRYVGKVLHIDAGRSLSLQHHVAKDETVAVQTGEIVLEYGPSATTLSTHHLVPGQRFLIRAPMVHRITAVTDSTVLETSTARPGWRHDVVRHADAYGREGTSAP